MPDLNDLTIVELTISNVLGVKAVHLTPDGKSVVITGSNGEGKSSVINSIWLALGGKDASKDFTKPVRDGEDTGSVSIDLGDLKVTRTWTNGGASTKLVVTDASGNPQASPQTLLDQLIGRITIDPMVFPNKPEKDVRAILLGIVAEQLAAMGVDLDALAERYNQLYDQRTIMRREVKTATTRIEGMPVPPEGTPTEEVSITDVAAALSAAQRDNAERERLDREAMVAQRAAEAADAKVEELRAALAQAEEAAKTAHNVATLAAEASEKAGAPDEARITAYEDQIGEAEQTNQFVRMGQELARATADRDERALELEGIESEMTSIVAKRAKALRDVTMPVEGLAIDAEDEDRVTFNGIPLKQIPPSEQVLVGVRVAMALNPAIKVIRLLEASLLDQANTEAIKQFAAEHGFQLWIEKVEAATADVTIEAGEVKA